MSSLTWDGTDTQGQPLRYDSSLTWDGSAPQPTPRPMQQLRVLYDFTRSNDHLLEERANNVLTKLYDATTEYPTPPVLAPALQTLVTAFAVAVGATEQGGVQATANKNSAKANLVAKLRELAIYVQSKHGNDLATLLLSGFDAASTNTAPTPLTTPNITKVLLPSQGSVKLMVPAVKNARSYDIRYALVDASGNIGPWVQVDNLLSTRGLILTGLNPGAMYAFQVRATGGSTRESDWSNMVNARCM